MNVAVNRKTALSLTSQSPEKYRRHLSTAEERTSIVTVAAC